MKRPSFQFYPGDWRSNAKLGRCSHAERGIWIDLICLLHDSEEYGVLRWPLEDVAEALKCRITDLGALRRKGVLKGADEGERCEGHIYRPRHAGKVGTPVSIIDPQDGPVWFSSRMVEDEYVRTKRATKGGESDEPNPPPKDTPKPPPKGGIGSDSGPPSDGHPSRDARAQSSSSSSSVNLKPNPISAPPQSPHAGEPPDRADSPEGEMPDQTPAVQMAIKLRERGVPVQAANPTLQAWITDGYSLRQVLEAYDIARQRKGENEQVPPNYIDAILRNPPKKAVPPWWTTLERMKAKAAELGIVDPFPGEEAPAFRARIEAAIAAQKQAA